MPSNCDTSNGTHVSDNQTTPPSFKSLSNCKLREEKHAHKHTKHRQISIDTWTNMSILMRLCEKWHVYKVHRSSFQNQCAKQHNTYKPIELIQDFPLGNRPDKIDRSSIHNVLHRMRIAQFYIFNREKSGRYIQGEMNFDAILFRMCTCEGESAFNVMA